MCWGRAAPMMGTPDAHRTWERRFPQRGLVVLTLAGSFMVAMNGNGRDNERFRTATARGNAAVSSRIGGSAPILAVPVV